MDNIEPNQWLTDNNFVAFVVCKEQKLKVNLVRYFRCSFQRPWKRLEQNSNICNSIGKVS